MDTTIIIVCCAIAMLYTCVAIYTFFVSTDRLWFCASPVFGIFAGIFWLQVAEVSAYRSAMLVFSLGFIFIWVVLGFGIIKVIAKNTFEEIEGEKGKMKNSNAP